MNAMSRPSTSKARGICVHYNKPRGCFAGDKCKFLHGQDEKLTPFDQSKVCRWYAKGYCRNGDKCWFRHVIPVTSPDNPLKGNNDDNMCCICLEKPTTYGLLVGCGHVFCIECIRQWRDPQGKAEEVISSGATKKCPFCRAKSLFIVPSSHFCPHGSVQKEAVIDAYKASMARIPCRYFEETKRREPFCPFGCDCFYRHVADDGSPHVFTRGTSHYLRLYTARLLYTRRGDSPRALHLIDQLGATLDALRATLRDNPDTVELPSHLSDVVLGLQDASSTEHSPDNPDPEVETNPPTAPHTDSLPQEDHMVLTVAESNEELIGDDVLPSFTLLHDNLRMRLTFGNEDPDANVGGVDQRPSANSSVDRYNQWSNSRPPDSAIPDTGIVLSSFPHSEDVSLSLTDFEQQATTSQSSDETHTAEDPLSRRLCWAYRLPSGLQSPGPPPLVPVSSLADGADGEGSSAPAAVVHRFGSEESEGNSTQNPPAGPVCSIQEILETATSEVVVASGAHEEPASATDCRGRVVSLSGARSNVNRSARVRTSAAGKIPAGEKPSDEDVTAIGGGFMTDGRGRVIGTSQELVWQGEDSGDGEAGAVGDVVGIEGG